MKAELSMKTDLDIVTTLSFSAAIISVIAMSFYFLNRGIFTYWQMQSKILWLEIIFRYRDHTRKNIGHVGFWYYIFLVSIFISIISIFIEFALHMRIASWPIILVVAFSVLLLVPLIGYAIYNISKEKYY